MRRSAMGMAALLLAGMICGGCATVYNKKLGADWKDYGALSDAELIRWGAFKQEWKAASKPMFDTKAIPARYATLEANTGLFSQTGMEVLAIDGQKVSITKRRKRYKIAPGKHEIVAKFGSKTTMLGGEVSPLPFARHHLRFTAVFEEGYTYALVSVAESRFLRGTRMYAELKYRPMRAADRH